MHPLEMGLAAEVQASSRSPKCCCYTLPDPVGEKETHLVSTNYQPALIYMPLFNSVGAGVLRGMADRTFAICREPCPHLPRLLPVAAAPWPLCWISHRTRPRSLGRSAEPLSSPLCTERRSKALGEQHSIPQLWARPGYHSGFRLPWREALSMSPLSAN